MYDKLVVSTTLSYFFSMKSQYNADYSTPFQHDKTINFDATLLNWNIVCVGRQGSSFIKFETQTWQN